MCSEWRGGPFVSATSIASKTKGTEKRSTSQKDGIWLHVDTTSLLGCVLVILCLLIGSYEFSKFPFPIDATPQFKPQSDSKRILMARHIPCTRRPVIMKQIESQRSTNPNCNQNMSLPINTSPQPPQRGKIPDKSSQPTLTNMNKTPATHKTPPE